MIKFSTVLIDAFSFSPSEQQIRLIRTHRKRQNIRTHTHTDRQQNRAIEIGNKQEPLYRRKRKDNNTFGHTNIHTFTHMRIHILLHHLCISLIGVKTLK